MSDIISDVSSARDTFSSWDKCMEKTYCKWPAIIGIIIGSLIVLSIVWCLCRCICCGVQVCTCCCGGCGSCCGSGGGRQKQHKDDYSRMPPTPYGGYQPAPVPMAYGPPAQPQFATFDDPSRKIHEDSLPAMPSWDTATTRRVQDDSAPLPQTKNGDLEMGRLDAQPPRMRGGYNSVPAGPVSPITTQGDYFPDNAGMHHSYNSDLGAQRMGHNGNDMNGFSSVPLSPPPTYRSGAATPSISADHFAAGTTSPSPGEYNRSQSYHQQPSSYAPSMSTRYESPQQGYAPYPGQQQQQYDARPPSFLQPGRRPVNGSFREV